jgi:hypothetical protein
VLAQAVRRGRERPRGSIFAAFSASGYRVRGSGHAAIDEGRRVSTRTLLVLAAVTGLAILVAGAVQILLAR